MEVPLTRDIETKLLALAQVQGIEPVELVHEAISRLMEEDSRFRAHVQRGLAQADRGEFIEEEEMDMRVAKMTCP